MRILLITLIFATSSSLLANSTLDSQKVQNGQSSKKSIKPEVLNPQQLQLAHLKKQIKKLKKLDQAKLQNVSENQTSF